MTVKEAQEKLKELENLKRNLEKLHGFFAAEGHRTSGSEIVRIVENGADLSIPLADLMRSSLDVIAGEEGRIREAIGKAEVPL